jgi:uncharacterized membrane protein
MTTETPKFTHGQDAGKVVLALWLLVSPWMFGYAQVRLAVWNDVAVAIVVAAFSIAAMLKFTKWEEVVNIVAGFWLFASPWLLDFATLFGAKTALPATANHLAVGLAIVILSLWEFNLWERATQRPPDA